VPRAQVKKLKIELKHKFGLENIRFKISKTWNTLRAQVSISLILILFACHNWVRNELAMGRHTQIQSENKIWWIFSGWSVYLGFSFPHSPMSISL